MSEAVKNKIPVGISACLLGDEVRYNGGHKRHSYIQQTLGQYFEFRRFCPEVDIGLGIPRRPIRIVREGEALSVVDPQDESDHDYAPALAETADAQAQWLKDMSGYILKKDSPSCGMERVKVYSGGMPERSGVGAFAARVMELFPELPLEEEGRLGDSVLRENFIQRVYVYDRWKHMVASGLTLKKLLDFHARHKLILLSHCQKTYRDLGPKLAKVNKAEVDAFAADYVYDLMKALKKPASRGDHVNVLQHVQGYLKNDLTPEDKAELTELIARYQDGTVPLIVPITLLNHYFRKFPDEYIANSWYMHPYPAEMALQNAI
ncbi:DUF523 and DUF1722 domain-containing protein [Pseudohongiella nitratireducens]|uniref:YbgA family protein n=1 Tax=Pseudohongiella nitratireducens TaxID=1768907 RepID=UPI0030EB5A53|tara:strand:- start:8064 stop:9023 length:960 start_codon:yes stop_codon:yes gene_type:complete